MGSRNCQRIENHISRRKKKLRNYATVIEANIDDLNPEIYEYVMEKVLDTGANDIFLTNVQMKKNRPGILLTAVVEDADLVPEIERIIFHETSTIGIRKYRVERKKLERHERMVDTPWGSVKVKDAYFDGNKINTKAESDQCKAIARDHKVPLKEIYRQIYQGDNEQYQ